MSETCSSKLFKINAKPPTKMVGSGPLYKSKWELGAGQSTSLICRL